MAASTTWTNKGVPGLRLGFWIFRQGRKFTLQSEIMTKARILDFQTREKIYSSE